MWEDEESGLPSWDAWASFEPTDFDYGVFTSPEFNEAFDIANPEFYPRSETNPLGYDPNASYNLPSTFISDVKRVAASLGNRAWNALKRAFTDQNGNIDFRALATAGGALLPLLNRESSQRTVGYQGKIPEYVAMRQQVEGTYDPDRRPGSGGRRYFTDVAYVPKAGTTSAGTMNIPTSAGSVADLYQQVLNRPADEGGQSYWAGKFGEEIDPAEIREFVTAAQPELQTTQARGLAALNRANPLNAPPPAYQPPAAPPVAASPAAPAYNPAYSGDKVLQTVQSLLNKSKLAKGGIVSLQDGGFVVPADVVSHLGNGSSDAGLAHLARKGAVPIRGRGDGMSDSNPTMINDRQPAAVAHEEAYFGPKEVQDMGGAQRLYSMMDRIRKDRTGTAKQGRQINPNKYV